MKMHRQVESVLAEAGIEKVAEIADLVAGAGPNYVSGNFRAFGHFDFKADALIYSKKLNVIGVLVSLTEKSRFEGELKLALDSAAYLRHLLVGEFTAGKEFWWAPAVELILVVGNDSLSLVGDRLQQLVRQSRMLHSIGVNILPALGGSFEKADVRRAFCWLLRYTQQFFAPAPKGLKPKGRRKLELKNFRLPGRRCLSFSNATKTHIIHGYNGTGKSSIVEAIELLMTGKIERLGEGGSYSEVLTYRSAAEALVSSAAVELEWPSSPKGIHITHSVDELLAKPLVPGMVASSFRLDQRLMDRLTSLDSATLAKTFLESFFPEERSVYEKRRELHRKIVESLQSFPAAVRVEIAGDSDGPDFNIVKDRLSATMSDSVDRDWSSIKWALPLPAERLKHLARIAGAPSDGSSGEVNSYSARQIADWADLIIANLRPVLPRTKRILRLALQGISKMAAWRPAASSGISTDFATQLNRWLELSALVDLGKKNLLIEESLREAELQKWVFDEEPFGLIGSSVATADSLAELRRKINDWDDEWRQLFAEISYHDEPRAESGSYTPPRGSEPLSDVEQRSLNQAGIWLSQWTQDSAGLGDVIAKAQQDNSGAQWGKIGIGVSDDWAEPLRVEIAQLLATCEEVSKLGEGDSAVGRWEKARETLRAIEELRAHDVLVEKTFLSKIAAVTASSSLPKESVLNDALNELMALFTPARWAYGEVSVVYQPNSKEGEIGFTVGDSGARALLRLNTAELNIFAVALFLLCAPRLPNPMRLLVFDDPLQNMDELTVATLARGLGRLLAVFPETWSCLFLFHGEVDLEIFRRELHSEVYKLDWLRPTYDISCGVEIGPVGIPASFNSDPGAAKGAGPLDWLELRAGGSP